MYKYAKDVLEFELQNKNVSENVIKNVNITSTSKECCKDSVGKCILPGIQGRQKKTYAVAWCLKCECSV